MSPLDRRIDSNEAHLAVREFQQPGSIATIESLACGAAAGGTSPGRLDGRVADDVYHLVRNGFPNTVAILGSFLSDEQAELLIATSRPIVLMLDDDEAGLIGAKAAAAKLVSHAWVRSIGSLNDSDADRLRCVELVSHLTPAK